MCLSGGGAQVPKTTLSVETSFALPEPVPSQLTPPSFGDGTNLEAGVFSDLCLSPVKAEVHVKTESVWGEGDDGSVGGLAAAFPPPLTGNLALKA
jgi:hypothetical protein